MKIYNSAGIEIHDIMPDDSSVRYRSIMQDDNITLKFSSVSPVDVPVGSYADFEGQRYTLYYPEDLKKHHSRNFEYTLVMHSHREALKLYKFKDLSAKPYRLKFSLTATPAEFLQLLVDNMNEHDSGWSAGDCIVTDEKVISFNHEYCIDVLNRMAQEFATEYEVAGKTVHLRKVEKFKDDPLPLSYGKGNGFKSGVGRQNDGDKQPIGRLYVQGGERNIDFSTYGSPTLLLPKSATLEVDGKTYRTDADGMYITRDGNTNKAEGSYDGSGIYPHRTGTVSSVVVADAEKNFYDIIDSSIPSALNYRDCRIAGEKATIVFQSGALAGREFDIQQTDKALTGYNHDERKFEIVPAELDGYVMPGGLFVPAPGDKYVVFNISLPNAYVSDDSTKTGASWDLFRESVRFFSENEIPKFTFRGEMDGIWSRSKWLEIGGKIVLGGHVLFSDPQFQPEGVLIRITAVKDYLNAPHKPEITLSNAPVSVSFLADLGKVEAEEVVRAEADKTIRRFTQRQWRDARETMQLLESSMLNFSDSINPVTVQTMQLLVGDESLQFRFVNSKITPVSVIHNIAFNTETKILTSAAAILQHMTLGIDNITNSRNVSEYRFWDMAAYTSPPLEAKKSYYLYAKCQEPGTEGVFLLSENAIEMNEIAGYYHFLTGILNSEYAGNRSFVRMHGFTEVLPGQVTTDIIRSADGMTYFDLVNGIIAGKIRFLNSENQYQNLEDIEAGTSAPEMIIRYGETSGGPWYTTYGTGRVWMRISTDGGQTWSAAARFIGSDGESAPFMMVRYGASSTGPWYAVYTTGRKWMQISTDDGTTWSSAMKIVGEDGADGNYTDFQFSKNSSLTTAPTTGWQDAPPELYEGQYLWMRTRYVANGTPGAWGTSVRVSGAEGEPGLDGKSIVGVEELYYLSDSPDVPTGGIWSTTIPEWTVGKTIFTRLRIDYSYGAASFTEPQPYSAAEALQKVNIAKAVTDKFGTTIDGGLINTVTMLLREADSEDNTAGISGIQGELKDNPAFWAGGTYQQAISLIEFLSNMQAGEEPDEDDYRDLAKITMLHDGSAKIGDFIIENTGRIIIADPETGKERLVFNSQSIPAIADLLSGVMFGKSVSNSNAYSDQQSYQLPNGLTGLNAPLMDGVAITVESASFNVLARVIMSPNYHETPYAEIQLNLYRQTGTYPVANIATLKANFDYEGWEIGDTVTGSANIAVNKTIPVMPAGNYVLKIDVPAFHRLHTVDINLQASTFSWSFTQENERKMRMGLNGLMAFYSNNHFHFTENNGLDVKGKTNIPGVLLSGTVNSAGGWVNVWGAKKHVISSAVRVSPGTYDVYHSVGHNTYAVSVLPALNRVAVITSRQTDRFRVQFYTNASSPSLSDSGFDFTITGDNYEQ